MEKERAIQENELQSEIELAKREELLIAQRCQNELRRATEEAEAKRIAAEAAAKRNRLSGAVQAEVIQVVQAAEVTAERDRIAIYRDLSSEVMFGLAAREAASKLQSIEHLNVTPDLLGPLLTNLMQAGTRRLEGPERVSRKVPRVVVVTRRTEYEELLARHCTREQARFFLESREQSLEGPLAAQAAFDRALKTVLHAVPLEWRRTRVDRGDLDRFLFAPEDIVVALGQDGLVANTAKYLRGQRVIGVNPDTARNEGVLVRHAPETTAELLHAVAAGDCSVEERTMVQVTLDDGQQLLALNEVFLGHRTHQSARYAIAWNGTEERHSSSGVIVSSGTGCTGWARSVRRNRLCELTLPTPQRTAPRVLRPRGLAQRRHRHGHRRGLGRCRRGA